MNTFLSGLLLLKSPAVLEHTTQPCILRLFRSAIPCHSCSRRTHVQLAIDSALQVLAREGAFCV